ncbi:MAG: ABC transporter substrate-binding protein, partial [Chloroflexota bacterium]
MRVRSARAVIAATGILAVTALAAPGAAQDGALVRVGITLPLSGSGLASSGPIRDAVTLALAEAAIPGVRLEPVVLDHAVNGLHNPQQGARDMVAFVGDPAVLAVVGPFNSSVAQAQIPIGNEAGLLQCSPANTAPGLTQGDDGLRLRPSHPDRIAYVRVQATDDVQGPAMAGYAIDRL